MGEKSVFVFNRHSCNDEGCHVQNGQAVLLEFGSVIACNGFFMQLSKITFKNNAVNQYSIQCLKIILSEVDFHLESIPESQSVSASESEGGKSNRLHNFYFSCSLNESVGNSVEPFFHIKKDVLGSYHQCNHKYGETTGIQCTSYAFVVVCFSAIKCFNLEVMGFRLCFRHG